jgi:Arc/MetJ family transcription regulator
MAVKDDKQKIRAVAAEADKPGDNTLPDPTWAAKWTVIGIVVVAIIATIVVNAAGWAKSGAGVLKASEEETANFALFAGFYVVAQVIAGALAVVSPLLPPWTIKVDDATVQAAQIKADRGALQLALAALVGAVLSCLFGLYFLQAVGIHASNTVDALFTGATVAGGAKPLHDFVGIISNKKAPTTGTSGETTSGG